MVHQWGTRRLPTSPQLVDVNPIALSVDREAKSFQKMLQEIDKSFFDDENSSEQRQRMQEMEKRQLNLQLLCEEALRQEESINRLRRNDTGLEFQSDRPVEIGIVSTPRSVESLFLYDELGAAAMRGGSCGANLSMPLMPPLPPPPPPLPSAFNTKADPFSTEKRDLRCEKGRKARLHLRPPASSATTATTGFYRSLASPVPPLPSPVLVTPPPPSLSTPIDNSTQNKKPYPSGGFLCASQEVESSHPYGADDEKKLKPSHLQTVKLLSGAQMRGVGNDRKKTAVAALTSGASNEANDLEENFDMKWEDQLVKWIHVQTRTDDPPPDNRNAISPSVCDSGIIDSVDAESMGGDLLHAQDCVTPVSFNNNMYPIVNEVSQHRECTSGSCWGKTTYDVKEAWNEDVMGKEKQEKEEEVKVASSSNHEKEVLLQENHILHRDLEAQNKNLCELMQKMENLARHLVRSIRERTQLQHRVEGLESLLEGANAEVKRLKASELQSEKTSILGGWRAAIQAKERELRICEDEICRLRTIIEKHMMQSPSVLAQQEGKTAYAQLRVDYEDILRELGVAHMRRREAETHAECISAELEAAQTHIQSLDNRLAEAERAAVVQRLREMQGCLLPSAFLHMLPSLSASSVAVPSATEVATWSASAQRELARLTSLAESLAMQQTEYQCEEERRLSHLRQENKDLRVRCRACEAEMRLLESEIETQRVEWTRFKSFEQALHEQLIKVQNDAKLLSDLLQDRNKNAEDILNSLEGDTFELEEVKQTVNAFVKGTMRDSDTVLRFFAALQEVYFVGQLKQYPTEMPTVSGAAKAQKEALMQAVEAVMASSTRTAELEKKPENVALASSEPLCMSVVAQRVPSTQETDVARKEEETQGAVTPSQPFSSPLILPPSPPTLFRTLMWQKEKTTENNNVVVVNDSMRMSGRISCDDLGQSTAEEKNCSKERMEFPTSSMVLDDSLVPYHQGELKIPSCGTHVEMSNTSDYSQGCHPYASERLHSSPSREASLPCPQSKIVNDILGVAGDNRHTKSSCDIIPELNPSVCSSVGTAVSVCEQTQEIPSFYEELEAAEEIPLSQEKGLKSEKNASPSLLETRDDVDLVNDAVNGMSCVQMEQQKTTFVNLQKIESTTAAMSSSSERGEKIYAEPETSFTVHTSRVHTGTKDAAAKSGILTNAISSGNSGSVGKNGAVRHGAVDDYDDEPRLCTTLSRLNRNEVENKRDEPNKKEEKLRRAHVPTATSNNKNQVVSSDSSKLGATAAVVTEVAAAQVLVSDAEKMAAQGTSRESRLRASVAMEFPSLRHPVLGSGRHLSCEDSAPNPTLSPSVTK